jgi:Ca2+-transporting ATPase
MESAYTREIEEIYKELNCSSGGLLSEEASKRLLSSGYNQLKEQKKNSAFSLLLEQFKNVLIIILLLATIISAYLGHGVEAIAISVIVLFAILFGFIQEYRAGKAIEALKKMAAPTAKVIRDGKERVIASNEIVPGDVFLLTAGDRIPADARLIEAANLRIDESSLTGESLPSGKDPSLVIKQDAPLGDRKNIVFSGTSVSNGRGKALAVATAMDTEFGKIAKMLHNVKPEKTPLQKNLDRVGAILAYIAIGIILIIVSLGLYRGQPFIEMLMFGIALAVAVVPEALPAVVTISLALGVKRMVKRNALMRRLPVVETLGSTTVICSDKTGTLTRNEMTVTSLYYSRTFVNVSGSGYIPEGVFTAPAAGEVLPATIELLLTAGVLCNDAALVEDETGAWSITGDPTEGALIVAARKGDIELKERAGQFPRVGEQAFSSETKMMITLHAKDGANSAFIKGAPEVIVTSCNFEQTDAGVVPLDQSGRELILEKAKEMASKALRVLAVATKPGTQLSDSGKEMTFLGLVGMIDPPRAEAKEAVRKCIEAGIRPVMITGDHLITAQAIAGELGIFTGGKAITGAELQLMTDDVLGDSIESIQVFARVAPEHKLRIIEAFHRKGHIVAMTGDGVNDAPALKKANIGISMGITGTDVTKEASAMMLTDDNFASIVSAVEEGRGIYDNIKKYLTYLLSSNAGEIGLMAGATLMGLPLPLSAVQILYVNLATDGLPALALAVDPIDKDIMQRKPNDPGRGIFTKQLIVLILTGGVWSTIVNLFMFQWARTSGRSIAEAMTMTFVSLVMIEFFKAYVFRAGEHSIFKSPFSNKWLNMAILWEMILLGIIIYVPFMQKPFGTFSLTLEDLLIIAGAAITIIPVIEIVKFFIRRGWFGLRDS